MAKAEVTREKIVKVAAQLFAKNGIKETSVRTICTEAGVTHNMVGHHFGGKDGLVNELISRYADGLFTSALRIIEEPVQNKADFETRYKLFQKESLASALENRELLLIFTGYSGKTQCSAFPQAVDAALGYQKSLLNFLKAGVRAGAVRKDADVPMLTAALWDRIMVQVRHVNWLSEVYGDDNILNPKFQKRWLKANVDAFLYGIVNRED